MVLKRAYSYAVELEMLDRSPLANLKKPKAAPNEQRHLHSGASVQTLGYCQGRSLVCALLHGDCDLMRSAELFGLRWSDVHLDQGYLRVSKALVDPNGLELGEPKTATSKRRCDLPASAIEVLREHKRATEGNLNEHGLVFPSKTGGFVDRCNFHSLRHAGNCMLAAGGGVALKSLQVRLGHSTSRTTFDAYTHLFESDGGHAAQAMDLLLRGVTRGVTASDGPLPENAGHEKNPYG